MLHGKRQRGLSPIKEYTHGVKEASFGFINSVKVIGMAGYLKVVGLFLKGAK